MKEFHSDGQAMNWNRTSAQKNKIQLEQEWEDSSMEYDGKEFKPSSAWWWSFLVLPRYNEFNNQTST